MLSDRVKVVLVSVALTVLAIIASVSTYEHAKLIYAMGQIAVDPTARPDPWTGTMAELQEEQLKGWVLEEIAKACREARERERTDDDAD